MKMEVVTIESSIWKRLNQKLEFLTELVMSLKEQQQKQVKASPLSAETAFIRVREAIKKYGVNRTTLNSYCKEYTIKRLHSGKENLIHEIELIEALKKGRKNKLDLCFLKRKKAA